MYHYGTGATAAGVKVKDGVVLGAEKRFSYGGYILSKVGKKVFAIGDRFGIACAGLVADIQAISRIMLAEVKYYETVTGRPMSVRTAAKLLANVLYSYKLMPLISETLFGGVDNTGPHLFVMDPLGSLIEDDYASVGTGAPIAIGIIESEYKPEMNIDEAKNLVIKSIKAAVSRDALSGDGIDILIITSEGIKEEFIRI